MKLSLVHWLIVGALVANAAVYFMPQEPAPAAPVDLNATGGLRQLKLLSELEEMPPPREEPGFIAEPTIEPEPVVATESSPEAADGEQPAVEEMASTDYAGASGDEPAAEAAQPASEGEPSEPSAVAPSPDDVEPEPQPEPQAEQVVVLEPESQPEPEPEPEPLPEPEPPPPPRCWLAGPVESDALSEQLAADFAGAGIGMDLVLRTVEVAPDHWVYLPTSGSQADIRRLSRELRQDGFDNFQITDGPLAGSLSMGLFRSEERAIALRGILRGRGQQADIYRRPAYREQPWAAIDDTAREALGWPDAEGLLPGYESLELVSRACPDESDG